MSELPEALQWKEPEWQKQDREAAEYHANRMKLPPAPIALVPTQSDSDRAAAVKQEIADRLNELGAAMDKATAAGFEVNFQMIKQPWSGKNIIGTLIIAKHY